MKLTNISQSKKDVELSIGIVFVMFLLSGCITPVDQTENKLKCREAEKVVSQAEQEYDTASYELFNGKKDEDAINNFLGKIQNLGNTQERAFQVCNIVNEVR
ncbi:MAG TPA: hypothetical protein V6D11_04195 [Waterburya sp.]|jgi:hypothetical protein